MCMNGKHGCSLHACPYLDTRQNQNQIKPNLIHPRQQFNALRLPISLDVARDPTLPVPRHALCGDRSLETIATVGQLLDRVFERAADRGIVVVLALHAVGSDFPPGLWYSPSSSSAQDFVQAWRTVLSRYVAGTSRHWNVLGIDLLHRPGRGRGTWGDDDPDSDWKRAAQDTAVRLLREFAGSFHGLVFVQGLEGAAAHDGDDDATDLRGVHQLPLTLGDAALDRRLVYAALVVRDPGMVMSFGHSPRWPQRLSAARDALFGFVERATGKAVVIAKWGGMDDDDDDAAWQAAVVDYLASRCLDDTFYWALNANVSEFSKRRGLQGGRGLKGKGLD